MCSDSNPKRRSPDAPASGNPRVTEDSILLNVPPPAAAAPAPFERLPPAPSTRVPSHPSGAAFPQKDPLRFSLSAGLHAHSQPSSPEKNEGRFALHALLANQSLKTQFFRSAAPSLLLKTLSSWGTWAGRRGAVAFLPTPATSAAIGVTL